MKIFAENDYIPMEHWGYDHWSTLGYMASVMIDYAGFQVGYDVRMRQNRRNYRVMYEQCQKPRRSGGGIGMVMDDPKHRSRLHGADCADNHDDWCCIQDMANEGLIQLMNSKKEPIPITDREPIDFEPGDYLRFTDKGYRVLTALQRHKCEGGSYKNFIVFDQKELTGC